ncbi:Tyrosine-protein kinase Fer [Phytophthora ramorum]|uniref:Tyrosine-protein kinase Fer n=1 Tax=Phytophthora ramorum TaxID=164328 RepID=UPI0030B7650C|nr:Tyrosine-protein kinase Fer [Phytophthora ramorum]
MLVMATSSSEGSDASLRAPTSLRGLLSYQLNTKPHAHAPNAAIPASKDRLRPPAARQQCSTLIQSIYQPLTACSAPFPRFPASRYAFLRAYESPMHSRALPRQHSVVAIDLEAPRLKHQVLLTSFSKASVTDWQLEHVGRVGATLQRQPAVFQRLLQIWEAGGSWVLVQELRQEWAPLRESFADVTQFSEEKLRRVVFQVAALVYFLHRHGLSLAGELVHYDLVMAGDQATFLLHLDLILSGCILVPATEKHRAADIAAIGMLMFQIAMMPRSPSKEVDIRYVEGSIEDQLDHLSSACRDLFVDCLTAKLTAEQLLARKWLRQVDFLHNTHKLDGVLTSPESRNALLKSLLWKLAALCMMDWLRRIPDVPEAKHAEEEEEAESSRQRNRKPTRRIYTRSRLYVPNGMLRRGPLPVPVPAGHSLLPQDGDNNREQRRHLYTLPPENSVHDDRDSERWRTYDDFNYDFPSFYSSPDGVLYDNFEGDNDAGISEEDSEGEFMSLPTEERRSSLSNFLDGDGVRNLQREVVRSLQHEPADNLHEDVSHTQMAYEGIFKQRRSSTITSAGSAHGVFGYDRHASHDAVHFSAFGPAQIMLCDCFRIDIWAYLKQQRESMLEVALEHNEVESGQRVQPFHIQRGTLVTISIEPSERFGIKGEGCKSFRWHGDITGVSFDLFRITTRSVYEEDEADELCIAKIVAGTRVSVLYIRLHAVTTHTYSAAAAGMTSSSDLALLDAHMEHVAPNVRDIPKEDLELIRPIGHGAFGDAVLARWKSTSQDVVVKTMNQDAYRASDALAEFHHEAAVMNLLGKHPHVVELIGVSNSGPDKDTTDSRNLSLVTEYLPNGSVENVLGISANPEAPASSCVSLFSRTIMARDAAHGLANIHQGNFLHRDIAARNCLVDSQFRVKVCDFGLSRRLRSPSAGFLGSFLFDDDRHGFGPLKWMAPESITPPHLFSTYSDSYMFGVLLYEIFSGQPPFPNLSSQDAAALILEGHHVPIPSSLPTAHRQLMEQCFDVHPLRRPSMDQIYTTLDEWVLQDTKTAVTTS